MCRLPLDNAVNIASNLLQIGIRFKTLARLPPNWKAQEQGTDLDVLSLPTPMEIPYRSKQYSFGTMDYSVYERQRQMLFSQRHLRAACLAGGILWRLGRDLLREEEVLSGPTDTIVVFGEGVFYRDAQGNLWCDDTLTEHEMDLVCGLHTVATGTCYSVPYVARIDHGLGNIQAMRTRRPRCRIGPFTVLGWQARLVCILVGGHPILTPGSTSVAAIFMQAMGNL
jgi:hypothetical protein